MQYTRKIMRVTEVPALAVLKQLPTILLIDARGEVRTEWYTNARLELRYYVTLPADGIYDFDFVADPPAGPVPEIIFPVHTQFHWEAYPITLKGVRVHAEANCLERLLEQAGSYGVACHQSTLGTRDRLKAEGEKVGNGVVAGRTGGDDALASSGRVGNGFAAGGGQVGNGVMAGGGSTGVGGSLVEDDKDWNGRTTVGIGGHGQPSADRLGSHELTEEGQVTGAGT